MSRPFQLGAECESFFEIFGGIRADNVDVRLWADPISIQPCCLPVRILTFHSALGLLNCRVTIDEFLARSGTLVDYRSLPEGCDKGASWNVCNRSEEVG